MLKILSEKSNTYIAYGSVDGAFVHGYGNTHFDAFQAALKAYSDLVKASKATSLESFYRENPPKIKVDDEYLTIEVHPGYEYDIEWGRLRSKGEGIAHWVDHLRGKVWWSNRLESEFIRTYLYKYHGNL